MKPSLFDRAVLAISPQWGVQRLRAKTAAAALMRFDGASKGRRTKGWAAPGTDADHAAYGSRDRLRNLSRDFIRNRPYAHRGREVVVANVVGTGVSWSVVHGDQTRREQIEAVLKQHMDTPAIDARGECDIYEMQAVVMSAVFSDGEVLARRRMRSGVYGRGLTLPFQVELIEPDLLDVSKTKNGNNDVIEGVEYSPVGEIEAYWIYDQHPGAVNVRQRIESRRVSWRDILHVRRIDRPGQLRGVPWLAPVMMTLGELADYQEAQILKQRMAALIAGVLQWEPGTRPEEGVPGGLDRLEPGAIVSAPDGASVKFTQPPKVNGYDEFMAGGLRAVAVGLGLSYEALSGDMRRVNFSSARMGRMEMDRCVQMWQRNLMIGQFCRGIERWIAEAWPMQPVLPAERFGLDWTAPRRPLIDPTKEIPAMVDEIAAGLSSRQRKQRELGYDPDAIRRERVEDMREDEAAGLPPVATESGASAGAQEPEDFERDDDEQRGRDE